MVQEPIDELAALLHSVCERLTEIQHQMPKYDMVRDLEFQLATVCDHLKAIREHLEQQNQT